VGGALIYLLGGISRNTAKMLSTFENAQRQHLRRKERERHLQRICQMEEFAISYEFGDPPSLALADAFSGCPLQKLPEPSAPRASWLKSRSTWLLCTILLVFLILTGFLAGVDWGKHEERAAGHGTYSDLNIDTTALRHDAIIALIMEWGLTSWERLQDESSPAFLAMQWLVYTDVESVASSLIRTRFVLACLYFATHNPTLGNTWTSDDGWLSSSSVCSWHGVDCLKLGGGIGLLRSLNLSSNALSGTIPNEIGLLELEIRALDLSENRLSGTIPDSLFHLGSLCKSIEMVPPC